LNTNTIYFGTISTALASSKSEARRFLQAGAIYINDKQVSAEVTGLTEEDFNDNYAVLRRGKNNQVLLTLK
jgi:tyrosyl-tRNA synthetase